MPVYITVPRSPSQHQMTIEEFLSGAYDPTRYVVKDTADTYTYVAEKVSSRALAGLNLASLISHLQGFNESTARLRAAPRETLYRSFSIPKRSGGLRRIDAPGPELMDALRRLKLLLEEKFFVSYHTSAFAYVRKRCTVDAIRRHQANKSRWFAKLDLTNFFGSTTLEFAMRQFGMIFPFSEIMKVPAGRQALETALELAFLNGGLPQGTPISPLITNVMMIPIDHALAGLFRDFDKHRFVYTRYADDFLISSQYDFDIKKVEDAVVGTLKRFQAPFFLNKEKTRYGSSAGRNYNLGIVLTKDNEITVGRQRKKHLQSMLRNFVLDTRRGVEWPIEDVQTMQGQLSYCKMVEGDAIDRMVAFIGDKLSADIPRLIKAKLN